MSLCFQHTQAFLQLKMGTGLECTERVIICLSQYTWKQSSRSCHFHDITNTVSSASTSKSWHSLALACSTVTRKRKPIRATDTRKCEELCS